MHRRPRFASVLASSFCAALDLGYQTLSMDRGLLARFPEQIQNHPRTSAQPGGELAA